MCDKSNAMTHAGGLWQRVFKEVGAEYPQIKSEHMYVDALCMQMVRDPRQFDVIVTNNMFGDIITDLAAALQGGLGMAASGNIHPGKTSMFEPVHGSAPPIAGKNIANPMGAILTAAMMLAHLGFQDAANRIESAVLEAVRQKKTTQDIGGTVRDERSRRLDFGKYCGWRKRAGMKLIINGEDREFNSISTLSDLLVQLGMKPDRVAVELNRELVPRDRWPSTQLARWRQAGNRAFCRRRFRSHLAANFENRMKVDRRTVDLSSYPDLVVIYLGMRVNRLYRH